MILKRNNRTMKLLIKACLNAFLGLLVTASIVKAQATGNTVFMGAPKFNGASIVGNYPNTPLLFPVPASGQRPMRWTAHKLPAGLVIDKSTGIISGNIKKAGTYTLTVKAANAKGKAQQKLTIVIGDKLALTPPMGWNSWNTFASGISEQLIKDMADKMVSSGMRDLGYQYVNLDDFWQMAERGQDGRIQINKDKFPNGIKAVADYVHARGLKLGVYSDAADKTCGGVAGSLGFEEQDAADFASWGVDLLKYDYCRAPNNADTAKLRYTKMYNALRKTGRSIVFSICEWGVRKPWDWAAAAGGSSWRTTGDIYDVWDIQSTKDLRGVIQITDKNLALAKYAGPGHWNDADMLIVGIYGKGKATSGKPEATGCTDEEYRAHMSLWCLMASPLICGNDLRAMNAFTQSTLLNPEIIAINQDRLGKQATVLRTHKNVQIITKQLDGNTWAVGLFNRGIQPSDVTNFEFAELGLQSNVQVRDVWSHQNVKTNGKNLQETVLPHQCKVYVVKSGNL
jgi:alpha-galactosidase